MRILILIAIGLLLYVIIGNLLRKRARPSAKTMTETMVRCHYCGLHIAEQESLHHGAHYYCSKEHSEAEK